MYRIELRPGEETALRTIEELAVGIRNGVITSRARIWHNAGQKWLPIEFHPHYRLALQQLESGKADEPEPVVAISAPARISTPAPKSAVDANATLAPSVEDACAAADHAAPAVAPRNRSLGWPVGLFVAGCVIVASAKLTMSKTPLDTARASATDTPAATDSRPAEDSRRTSALPATTAAPAAEPAAPIRKIIVGGGVVHGPTQVPPPAPPPVSHTAVANDTIPSAPSLPALDLTLPSTDKPATETPASDPAPAQANADSIAR
jgi:hypothetical protein